MGTAEKKSTLPGWAINILIWCGPTLFFLLIDLNLGLVLEKETIPTFLLIPVFGLMVTRVLFLFRSHRSLGAKIGLAVLWVLLQAVLWFIALFFPIITHHCTRSDALDRFETRCAKIHFISATPEASLKSFLFPLELGDPEAMECHVYSYSFAIFQGRSCTLLCRYGEEEYEEAKAALEARYRFRTQLLDTGWTLGEAPVKQIEPYSRIGDDFFRVLLPRDEESEFSDQFYKNCLLIVTNDVRHEIGYIVFSDFDLDIAEDLAEFLKDECGWKYIR